MRKAAKTSTTPDTRTTRRAIVAGIAATTALPAAAANAPANLANAPDPVHALIAVAAKTRKAISDQVDQPSPYAADDPRQADWLAEEDAAIYRLVEDDWAAVNKITVCQPTTAAGVAESLRFFESRMNDTVIDSEATRSDAERMQSIFSTLAMAVERIVEGQPL